MVGSSVGRVVGSTDGATVGLAVVMVGDGDGSVGDWVGSGVSVG